MSLWREAESVELCHSSQLTGTRTQTTCLIKISWFLNTKKARKLKQSRRSQIMRISMTIDLQSFESCKRSVVLDLLQENITPDTSTLKQFHNSCTKQLSHLFQCKRQWPFTMHPATIMTMQKVRLQRGTKIPKKSKTFSNSLKSISDQGRTTF